MSRSKYLQQQAGERQLNHMFGYVTVDKPELKVKEFYQYKAYYCGLCRTLKEEYGFRGRMTLTYDMTFLVVLLTSLYESETREISSRCPVHPVKKIPMLQNEITQYGAKMNILLSFYHFADDWQDDKSMKGLTGVHLFKKKAKKICREYQRQSKVIRKQLGRLSDYEKQQEADLDLVAGCFGELMAEIFVIREDVWEEYLRKFGFYLGKFIYIMDAYDDLEKDMKKGSYNPLKTLYESYEEDKEGYEREVYDILMMMAEASGAFEKLPCIKESELLRNIIYSGVWSKYNKLKKERQEIKENHDQQSL